MQAIFLIVTLLLIAGAMAYLRPPLIVATVASAVALLVITQTVSGVVASAIMVVAWLLWAALAVLNFRRLRLRYLSAPALGLLRRALPDVSQTEQDALDAGTVWWDAELFSGKPDWRRLLSLPTENLSAEEQSFLDGPVERLCAMVDEWRISVETGDLPESVWAFLKAEGFFGMIIPKEHGGKGFSARAHSRVIQKIASRCGTAAVSVMVPNSLGPAELLLRYGSEAQRQHYLPRLARGDEIPCFALTNPFAGSDAAAIPDRGIVCYGEHEGQQVLGMRVTWEKRYITLSPVATVVGLAFQLYDPDGLLGDETHVGITLALLPSSHPGVEIGRRHLPARQAFQNGPIAGKDVFIPIDWVIGGRERCGDGWRMLMNCLAAGRSISLPGSSTGGLKLCTRATGAYARVRKQFNVPIGKFEGVQEAIARIAANTYLVDAARDVTAAALDAGEEPAVLSALLKYQSTERLRQALNDAMDVHGGRAICDGPSNYLMAGYMAAPVAITVEGANILTRSLVIFGQGAMRCHPYLQSEIAAAKDDDPDRALAAFDRAFFGHIATVLSNAARAFFKNATGGLVGSDPSVGEANYWYAQIERASASFAVVADVALAQLGASLKRKESLSGRFADVLGELYLSSCALKRFEDDRRPQEDLVVLEYALRSSLNTVYENLDGIIANLPQRWSAWLLRRLVFPWGRRWRGATDAQAQGLAEAVVMSRAFRDRLCAGMYLADAPNDNINCLEHAAYLTEISEAAASKLRDAVRDGRVTPYSADAIGDAERIGVVTAQEAEQLRASFVALRRAIDVDDFEATALWAKREEPTRAVDAA